MTFLRQYATQLNLLPMLNAVLAESDEIPE